MSDTAARAHLHKLLVDWEELRWAWLKLLVYSSEFTKAQENELKNRLSVDLDERCERDQWQGVVGKRGLGIFVLTASFKKMYKNEPNAELLTIYLGEEGLLLPMKYKKDFQDDPTMTKLSYTTKDGVAKTTELFRKAAGHKGAMSFTKTCVRRKRWRQWLPTKIDSIRREHRCA